MVPFWLCWCWWRASPTTTQVMEIINNKEKKIKLSAKQRRRKRVGECGFCTVLACPPHPTHTHTHSLSNITLPTQPKSKRHYHIGFCYLLFLCPLCNWLCLMFLLPLSSTFKWVWNLTLNFLLLFD